MRNNFGTAANAVDIALERMSTGYKINNAKDNASGMFLANKMITQINGIRQAQKNVSDGVSALQTAHDALLSMNGILSRLRDLSVQASNGVYDEKSRNAIQSEADELIQQLNQIQASTVFNGQNLFGNPGNVSTTNVLTLSGGGGLIR